MSEPIGSQLTGRVWAGSSISVSEGKSVDDVTTVTEANAGDGDDA
ncbi:hypothetical protein [Natrinema sp. 74]